MDDSRWHRSFAASKGSRSKGPSREGALVLVSAPPHRWHSGYLYEYGRLGAGTWSMQLSKGFLVPARLASPTIWHPQLSTSEDLLYRLLLAQRSVLHHRIVFVVL
ncbi:hypothetical protein GGI35DRAFT_147846 [Trichoderma velutinum]